MSTHTNENSPALPVPCNTRLHGLTAREHAAIHLRVPMSGNPWLDEMITEARRWDAAQAAMAQLDCSAGAFDRAFGLVDFLTRQMKGDAQ